MSKSKSAAALLEVLESHKASDLSGIMEGNVVEVTSSMSPIDAANILWEHDILGAPVWDQNTKKYVGFFDMRDILSAVTASASKISQQKESCYNAAMLDSLREIKLGTIDPKLHLTVSYLAARNPFRSCPPDTSLEDLCHIFKEKHCHRVPIVSEEKEGTDGGRCTNIISQSALIKFLSTHAVKKEMEDETLLDVRDKGLPYKKKVVSVVDTSPAFEAFNILDSHRLSGIAVVDEDGKIIGNTSARDIKLAAMDKGSNRMDTDILSYLAAVRQATSIKDDRYPSCHVHENATLAHVVNLLAKTGYHRVFVVDKNVKPVGVVSVADVIRFAIDSHTSK